MLLAGGLTPENVSAAIGAVRPYGVDVSSGVEAAPGVKDAGKVARFVASARVALAAAGERAREEGGSRT
jgi:phosphoribosylanthranilate isomerase